MRVIQSSIWRYYESTKLSLTAGGGSSGEGALVGFHGSILGVGSDISGSVRAASLCDCDKWVQTELRSYFSAATCKERVASYPPYCWTKR